MKLSESHFTLFAEKQNKSRARSQTHGRRQLHLNPMNMQETASFTDHVLPETSAFRREDNAFVYSFNLI